MKKKDILWGLFLALALALILSPFASSWPDGLEWVAGGLGFLSKGEGAAVMSSPIADYAFPGISNPKLATALAGLVGTVIMFVLGYGVAYLLKRRNS
jgi:cobalt/nickel transport protein